MTQAQRNASRLTVERGMAEYRLDALTAEANEYLSRKDQERRRHISDQMRQDYLFDKINDSRSIAPAGPAIDVEYTEAIDRTNAAVKSRVSKSDWQIFFGYLIGAGLITAFGCWCQSMGAL